MSEKMLVDVVDLMNFEILFKRRFGILFKPRNYHIPNIDPREAFFEFEFTPTEEMITAIQEFARSIGGKAKFYDENKKFLMVSDYNS